MTPVANNSVSLVCGVLIFGIVFALLGPTLTPADKLAIMKSSGPASTGMTFIWLPVLYQQLGAGGRVLACFFFLALTFAALSSFIPMLESPALALMDLGMKRHWAIVTVSGAMLLMSIPTSLSNGYLLNQDFVWGVGLLLSGFFFALLVIHYGPMRFVEVSHLDGIY